MATATQADYPVTENWTDLAATITGAVSTACLLQNIGSTPVSVVWGGSSAPAAGTSGQKLAEYDSSAGTAAKIWVKALGAKGLVSTTLT